MPKEGPSELRRQLNDDRRRQFASTGRPLALVCECGDPDCARTVVLSVTEYERRRPGPILHDAHLAADEPLTGEITDTHPRSSPAAPPAVHRMDGR